MLNTTPNSVPNIRHRTLWLLNNSAGSGDRRYLIYTEAYQEKWQIIKTYKDNLIYL